MPSKSKKQRKFMAAAANNPDFARRAGIPQSVASEFHEADKNRMYEGGLAPMTDIIQRGFAPGLGALEQSFATGGKSNVANWSSSKRKNIRLLDLMAPWRTSYSGREPGKRERKRRKRAVARQEKGHWGDEILTGVKNPSKRRALVRAGWVAQTPPETRKGVRGAKGKKGKKYDTSLNKHTVFYPPGGTGPGSAGVGPSAIDYSRNLRPGLTAGQTYTPTRANIMSQYITPGGAEGGAVNMFYGGPLKRALREMEERKKREADPDYEPWMAYGTEPVAYKDIAGKGIKRLFTHMRMRQLGWQPSFLPAAGKEGQYTDKELKDLVFFPPGSVGTGEETDTGYVPPASRGRGPRGGGRGRRGGRGGGRRRPPRNGEDEIPPRIIPPGRTPPGGGLVPPTEPPPDYTPPDPRAGRDTPYSQALRAHRERVAATLGVPSGFAKGGTVSRGIPASREVGYQEGGQAKPKGRPRSENPYDPVKEKYQWRRWERKQGRDPLAPEPKPEAPPVAEAEEEELTWWQKLKGYGSEEGAERIDKEVEEMQKYRGGYIPESREVGYQMGGMADLREASMLTPRRGGVPPRMARRGMTPPRGGLPPGIDPRAVAADPEGYARSLQGPPTDPNDPYYTRHIGATGPSGGLQQVTGGPSPMRAMPPVKQPPGMRIAPPPGKEMMRPPSGLPMGGARVPPNMRGYLQHMRMMNRPRRAIPGPAGAGGAGNRVGQSDQQGGLARALQRGTGRPPMSRRQGFYR